jgi:heptosyltransferase-2
VSTRHSLVIQTSFLGDVVLTTPLVAELARRGPVTVVVTPAAAPLLQGHPDVAHVVPWDKRHADRGLSGFLRIARLVRARDPEATAYLAQGSHRSALLALAAGYRRRVGLATSAGRPWYTTRVSVTPGMHHAERLWRLACTGRAPVGADLRPRLFPSAADQADAEALLVAHGAAGAVLLALAPGSVWATKQWPYYAELARELAGLGRLVLVGGADDAALAARIAASAGGGVIDATGRLSLLASAALLGRCRVLVTNDSAPLHLASAMNTPTVAIFGPTVTGFGFGPLADRHEVAEVGGLACRPCHAHGPMTCPLGHFRCMRDLLPGDVLAAVRRLRGAAA